MTTLYERLDDETQLALLHPYSEFLMLVKNIKDLKYIDLAEFDKMMKSTYDGTKEQKNEWIKEDWIELDRLISLNFDSVEDFLNESELDETYKGIYYIKGYINV